MNSNSLRQLSCLIRSKIRDNIINNNTILYNNNIHTIEHSKPIVDKYTGNDWLLFKYLINLHQPELDKLYDANKLNTINNKSKIYYMNEKFYLQKKNKDYYKLKLPYTDSNDMFDMYLFKWLPGSISPIHNHPELGCIMRLLEGEILEKKYDHDINLENQTLLTTDQKYDINLKTTYIDDSQNYHSISNISNKPVYTLHVYGYNPLYQHRIHIFNEPNKNKLNIKKNDFNLLRYVII